MGFKPRKKSLGKHKKVRTWCPGKMGGFEEAPYKPDVTEITTETPNGLPRGKIVRCPVCNKRLRLRLQDPASNLFQETYWTLPPHKTKPT